MNELCDIDIPFWIDFPANGAIPRGALKAGIFKGESLYIGRAMYNNALTSGEFKIFVINFRFNIKIT